MSNNGSALETVNKSCSVAHCVVAGRRSGVGGVQLLRAKHCDHVGRNSKSKDRYGLELLTMCVVA